jgi:microcystin-dependent protein
LFLKHAAGELGYFTDGAVAQTFYTSSTEAARIDSDGRLLVGTSNFRQLGTTSYVPQVLLEGLGGGASTIGAIRNSDNTSGPSLTLGKSRSTAVGGSTIVQDGDVLADLNFHGADGTALIQAAKISAQVDGTPGANDMPGRLVFSTTADGASSPTERLRIASTGAVGLSGANYGTSGQVLTSQGSGAAPQWTSASGNPVGTVISVATSSAPTGYLKCNGAAVSRSTYAALFAAISTQYGAGDGSTTFNVPDLRGEFIRGWDDGRGVDSGRSFGTAQGQATKAPNNPWTTDTQGGHNHGLQAGGFRGGDDSGVATNYGTAFGNQGDHMHTISGGDSETRPRNVALLYCIKF